ncbi:hypothetical protein HVZ46_18035 [Citrobacter freundii]|jgi:hypothetical protein|uniref:hypothetical protein n=1 Tax=Citrobacter freundii TaxID=546 RepID=UPI00129CD598|nr:hypothetical protein [Citrobacter freundii]QLR72070.1 hypothetical protein HV337_05675 [Citrobacter freundii]QLY51268.1 hypothetical protein HV186_05630 [Citrobacter freundii]QMD26332.1 hypothetical protein HVZ46_18035 [Citrobacter freundii]
MMSIIINEVNFDDVIEDARKAVKNIAIKDWSSIQDLITNIARGMVDDVEFIAKKKLSGEFNEYDARAFLDDNNIVIRIRLRAVLIKSLELVEKVWNAMAEIFRDAINRAIGWVIL